MASASVTGPVFPGRVIKAGSEDKVSVLAIQKRLNQAGCGPVQEDGVFSAETLESVQLFQSRSVDFQGHPLVVDGQIGPMTWASLFKLEPALPVRPTTALLEKVLVVADLEVGIMEEPP